LAQKDAFGHIADLRLFRNMALHAYLVAHLAAERFIALECHALSQQPCRQPTRLEHHHLARPGIPAIEHDLRHLSRLARTRRRFDDNAVLALQRFRQLIAQFIDGKLLGIHGKGTQGILMITSADLRLKAE